jgi:hypothetical protein
VGRKEGPIFFDNLHSPMSIHPDLPQHQMPCLTDNLEFADSQLHPWHTPRFAREMIGIVIKIYKKIMIERKYAK